MAKLTVTVAVVLLLFAVAQARFPPDLEKKDVNQGSETVLPESDEAINFLRLPTEKPESEIEIGSETDTDTDTPRFADWDLGNAGAKLTETETSGGETETVDSAEKEIAESEVESDEDSSVVTVITFRPSKRHFRWLPFPSGRRGRHEHGHGHFRGGDIGYGNDMILSEEGAKFEDRPRHVPGRWMRFHGGDDMRMRHHRFGNPEFMRRDREYDHHEHDHEHHHEHEHEHDHEHEHHHEHHRDHDHHHEHDHDFEQSNGFVGKIRKFLTNF